MFVRLRWSVRLLVAVLCTALASTLLVAAAPPSTAPTLVLFPFREAKGLDPRYGTDYVTKLAGVLTAAAAVKVVLGDPATAPTDYLHATKADGGDYYLTGFVAPPANGAQAVIEQLVSARSGTIVWSATAHIANDQDILNQGPVIQGALLTYATRGYFAILNPTPKPVARPTAAPKKNSISVPGKSAAAQPKAPLDLPNEAYGFSSKPTAPPKVYASADHPSRFVVLAIAGTTVPPVIRDYAVSSLITALSRHGQTAALADPERIGHRIPNVQMCKETGGSYLVMGTVSTKSNDATSEAGMWTEANLTLAVYDCGTENFEHSAKPLSGAAFSWKTAVDHASNTAVTDYLLKMHTVAHA
ncbi:MAG TPA: hypothetical protein VIJ64_10115 [Candidatus Lustribacter sp.]